MSGTLLEQTRALHEDLERLERMIVKELAEEAKTHRVKVAKQHRVKAMTDKVIDTSAKLTTIYKDDDHGRRDEIAVFGGKGEDGRDAYSAFYDRLRDLREYHRRFPSTQFTEAEDEGAGVPVEVPRVEFTGEEGHGRFLDLHPLHNLFQNAKFGRVCEYAAFVRSLAWDLASVPREQKNAGAYRAYVSQLLGYLEGFYQRAQPLGSLDKVYRKTIEGFDAQWRAGAVVGWEDRGRGGASGSGRPPSAQLDLTKYGSMEALEAVGGEGLKGALMARGMKCGGSVRERAERLWSVRSLRPDQIDKKLLAPTKGPAAASAADEGDRAEQAARATCLAELKITRLSGELRKVVEDTLGELEKRATMTFEELEAERAEEEENDVPVDEEAGEEGDEYVYNPLKLPLGPDGKPIPYWLWKLHGLQRKFTCEICGNYTYAGRRAFEKHFKEPRHQQGMAALGVPNTRAFFEVTSIEDALRLHRSMQDRAQGGFRAEDEELEDAEGNSYDRRTYELLKRQGVI